MIKPTKTDKIVQAIISAQLSLNMNEDIKNSNSKAYSGTLKYRTKAYLEELIKKEQHFDLLFENKEQTLKQAYDVMQKFVEVISKLPVWEMENFTEVVKAYLKDRNSIEGIVRKVNKN